VEFVGLARVPRRVAEVLSAAASSASLAGAELYALSRGTTDDSRLTGIVADVKRSSDEAVLEAAQMLGGGIDRDDVIAIAQSLRVMADRIAETAGALVRFGPSRASWEALAGVERDLAREVTALVGEFDGRPKATDRRFERVESLHQEGRRLLRAARAALLTQDDLLAAVAGQSVLDRIELAMVASRESARTVRRVLVKHQ
jgi:hypothetical protein